MRFTTAATVLALLSASGSALTAPPWPDVPGFARPDRSFVLLGDSTTKCDGGWGPGFCSSTLNITTITCINLAVSGGTTGWFFESGLFKTSLAVIGAEASSGHRPVVTIQYGHNDQKFAPPESMGRNLTTIVKSVRAVGGEPVLLTSLTRRNFKSDGTIDDALADWAAETIKVAKANKVALVDLHAASIAYTEAIGPDASHRLN
ncbi:SGNH hydrolase [Exidia glandulosa HHB12029]|uniref:SGNH hydrolase n=1 Tax=Exidia glandulosa HHB12029 TaxID=1314781 RepID=A0A165CCC2_EXIGL|nr:SGNH hydrolase [Exidia glandulosa HHB12029]